MNWHLLHRLGSSLGGGNVRGHAIRAITTAAILLGAPPGWTQSESVGAPNPENVLTTSPFAEFLARFSRPQTAEAAPRAPQKQTQRMRSSRTKAPVVASAPEAPAPVAEVVEPEPPQQQAWPNAQENVGAAGLVPVVIKTVRELVEAEAAASLVQENELSDLDLAARPLARLEDSFPDTDGRASADDAEWRGGRIAAFAENLKAMGGASWLEPMLLALAGAIAAFTARRVFAG